MTNLTINLSGKNINLSFNDANTTTTQKTEKLEWSETLLDGETVNYEKAEKAIKKLGDGWRFPTRFELESLLDLSRHEPAIDTEKFPDTKSTYYWSSSPCAWNETAVWVVLFSLGYVDVSSSRRYDLACVRAVRSSQ